ncbi:MAG: hypothetical protein OES09_18165, partial [Gammaproteobacteria bacterium]|nr:hypothetical protein [Gammaproteobacteria bacterium]
RDKNRRTWIRLLTLFRRSEVHFTLNTLDRLLGAGVPSVVPLVAVERRRFGVVVDSWLFYRYREGVRCEGSQFPQVIETLDALHRAGFRHEDPRLENYLYDENEVFVLDIKGKPRLGKVSDYYDFMLLQQHTREVTLTSYLEPFKGEWSYRIAAMYGGYRWWRNKAKKWIRRNVLRRPDQS